MKALRRCPDMSRTLLRLCFAKLLTTFVWEPDAFGAGASVPRDGIVVSALSFLPPLLYEDSSNIDEVHRSIGRIGACVAPVAAGDMPGAQRKAYRTSDALKCRPKSSRRRRKSKRK